MYLCMYQAAVSRRHGRGDLGEVSDGNPSMLLKTARVTVISLGFPVGLPDPRRIQKVDPPSLVCNTPMVLIIEPEGGSTLLDINTYIYICMNPVYLFWV